MLEATRVMHVTCFTGNLASALAQLLQAAIAGCGPCVSELPDAVAAGEASYAIDVSC